jgi:hypothetical protein
MDLRDKENEEEVSIDFSKIKNIFKKKKEKPEEKTENDMNQESRKIPSKEESTKSKETGSKTEEAKNKTDEDEISIDLGKIKNFFKKENKDENDKEIAQTREVGFTDEVKKDITETEKVEAKKKGGEDELSIDFSKIKKWFKREEKEEEKEEEITVDWKVFINFFKKNRYALPVVLILIAIIFSTYFRMYPARLPVTDQWAQNSVYNVIKSNIGDQINQQYPNLPDANKNTLIEAQFTQVLEQQKDQIDQQVEATSNYFKSRMQDESGETYLLAIDPYLWYGEARNYIRYGHFGTAIVDGKDINFLRNGREGREMPSIRFHSYLEVVLYKVLSIFGLSLMRVAFLIPVIIIAVSIIPAFFIGRRLGGNLGGFFAAMIIAVNGSLLGRTSGGFSDTDPYNIMFPLFISWAFIAAFETMDLKKKIGYTLLAALLTGIFSTAWGGWWYVSNFIYAIIGIYLIYQLIINTKELKGGFLKYISVPYIRNQILLLVVFFFGTMIFVSLFSGLNNFIEGLKGPLFVIALKEVAVVGLWPNVLTTVAEFNVVGLGSIIPEMGGRLLFLIAVLGVILTVIKKNEEGKRDIKYAIFLLVWFGGTLFGFTRGVRFGILMVPAFAIAVGVGVGILYEYLTKWLSKGLNVNIHLSNTIVLLLFLLLLVSPIRSANQVALGEIPSMNDAWYDSLTAIKNDSEDAIITSWWDFGHWFVAISERRVTFDGADQGERIHWVGKSLLTNNETRAVGILRMLNCGQEKAPHVLEKYLNNDTVRAIDVLNKIIVKDKDDATIILKQNGLSNEAIQEVLAVTHCDDLIPQYYITSDDMIGKAGVWAHFGSWDFKRAKMWQTVRKLDAVEGTRVLREEFNLSESEADSTYYEIINNIADRWVSPWPGYLSGKAACSESNNILTCGNGLEVNLTDMKAYVPTQQGKVALTSLAFINSNEKFQVINYEGDTAPYSAAILPDGSSILMDPMLVGSMFTRLFFFDGHGLEHFKLWKVSWEPGEPVNVLQSNEAEPGEEVLASHILIRTENRTDEEALGLIKNISEQLNDTNFAELANTYSEDPSAQVGGNLGWFGRGVMIKEFEDAAFSLNIGEVSEPVKTQFGYHLIKVFDKRNTTENDSEIMTDENSEDSNRSEELLNNTVNESNLNSKNST